MFRLRHLLSCPAIIPAMPASSASATNVRCYARGPRSSAASHSPTSTSFDDADDDDPSDPGRHEPDFAQLNAVQRSHRAEVARQQQRIQLRTVGSKYFRTQHSNYLTWSEKEQIRRLHATDPDEWPIERLAESFPAQPDAIAKLIRNTWTPQNASRIAKHDRAVREAWQAFDAGAEAAAMAPGLREHLRKFGGRTAVRVEDAVPGEAPPRAQLPSVREDFGKILSSCKKYAALEAPASEARPRLELPALGGREAAAAAAAGKGGDTFLLGGRVARSKSMMYRELDVAQESEATPVRRSTHNPFHDPRRNGRAALAVGDEEDDGGQERVMEMTLASPERQGASKVAATTERRTSGVQDNNTYVSKWENGEVETSAAEQRRLSMPAIRDKITIPKKLWKQGATYQLEDCFYDDDGEFLYRVPGMTGRKV